jgi:hypothetical protein
LSDNTTLGVTAEHPIYSLDRQGFVLASDLREGERLLSKTGITKLVTKVIEQQSQPVYNLEIRQWHNFLVGSSGVVVHNACFENLKAIIDDLDPVEREKKLREYLKDVYSQGNITKQKNRICSVFQATIPDGANELFQVVKGIADNLPTQGKYDKVGYANFSPYSLADVAIDMQGEDAGDYYRGLKSLLREKGIVISDTAPVTQANLDKLADEMKIPHKANTKRIEQIGGKLTINGIGFTWHHHQDTKTMQLVLSSVHNDDAKHNGGKALVKAGKKGEAALFPELEKYLEYLCD